MKKYLRLRGELDVLLPTENKYVAELRQRVGWVDNLKDATADYLPSSEVTQRKLRDQLGLETTLEEVPDPHLMKSRWVIYREDG
jgi:hypothetical protein